ncbi:MAG: alpha/beta hydrolase [Candidatus Thiodiazotropha sp. (ex Semelilucina semeliformis)]|nr:alpha/beta hydrolase [Candidatus Thiodiazotropha sp. (ex Semelilucina semeliformis)]
MSNQLSHLLTTRLTLLLILLLITFPASSEIINLTVDTDLEATAELLPGQEEGKTILILHGFLQTRDFFTVRRLADALNDEGHTILLPNLALGINRRRQSLACEAIHTHSLEQDVREIAQWVEWLHKYQDKPVTIIGHSAGSLLLLAYLTGTPEAPIEDTLLISLIPFAQGPIAKESETDRLNATKQLAKNSREVSSYPLAFCDKFMTTAGNYLSYVNWNSEKSLVSLKKLSFKPMIILGGQDQRLGDDWLPRLKQVGAEVVEIDGANHFFNHEHEFDLVDTISDML